MRKEWDEGKEQGGVGGEIRKDIEVWTPISRQSLAPMAIAYH
jgi:hypothetical protein